MSNYLTSRSGRSTAAPLRRYRLLLPILAALGLSLAGAPAAQATTYSVKGAFEEGVTYPQGVAVDQSNDHVYVGNFYIFAGLYQFDSSGNPVTPSPFATCTYCFGVAVDPENRNVYLYDGQGSGGNPEIVTFELEPSGSLARSFTVTGGTNKLVQIASNSTGYIFYPNQANKSVQVFSPTASGTTPAPALEITGTGANELSNPQSVAVDSTNGKYYIVDSGNGGATPGRVQVFNGFGGYESTLDEGGSQDVAVDPTTGDVFVLDKGASGYHVVAYHYGETTPFADFGLGVIGTGALPNRLAVDHKTGDVYVSDTGNGKVWIFEPGIPPEVAYPTPSVTGLSASEATLHGEVNPKGNEIFYHFEYGTTTGYGTKAPVPDALVGEGGKFKPESVTISGLEANTTYHFRLVATNAAGGAFPGADETFTTPQAPPVILTGSVLASEVTENDAFFNATLNPQNPAETHALDSELETRARYWFNYGLYPFEDASGCTPSGSVPYASAPATPIEFGAHTLAEEQAGIPVSLDLATASVVLHPGMASRALQPNTVYRFQVVAENVTENLNTRTIVKTEVSCQPEATFITLPPVPLASTGAASAVTQTAATLSGSVTPGSTGPNSDTTWRFQWGTSTSYTGGSVPATPGDAGMGTSAVAVSTALEGLAPNTTYHYRLVASNANEDPSADPAAAPQVADGADHTFATPPVEPFAGGQPKIVSETEVTLEGHANPSGHPLQYRFEYGSSTAYGQGTALASAGAAGEYTPVSATLTGLSAGTYHYRLVAVGAGGNTYSADSTFTLYAPAPAPAPGSNPFSPGTGSAVPFPMLPLLSIPSFPAPPTETVTKTAHKQPSCKAKAKKIKNAKKRAQALKRCKKPGKKANRSTSRPGGRS